MRRLRSEKGRELNDSQRRALSALEKISDAVPDNSEMLACNTREGMNYRWLCESGISTILWIAKLPKLNLVKISHGIICGTINNKDAFEKETKETIRAYIESVKGNLGKDGFHGEHGSKKMSAKTQARR